MDKPLTLYCDISDVAANPKEPRSHKRSKHVERKYHVLRDIVQLGDAIVLKIPSARNLTDPFTKTLPVNNFKGNLEGLGLRDMSHLL